MPHGVLLDKCLSWAQVAKVAEGAPLSVSDGALGRIRAARALVTSIVGQGVRAYGVNTGVGALCDVVVPASKQMQLSRNIVMSHAVGVGPLLEPAPLRAIMAAAINNFAHGHSGVRPAVVEGLAALLNLIVCRKCRLTGLWAIHAHGAHWLVLSRAGRGCTADARAAQKRCARSDSPLVLEAKGAPESSTVPCATGPRRMPWQNRPPARLESHRSHDIRESARPNCCSMPMRWDCACRRAWRRSADACALLAAAPLRRAGRRTRGRGWRAVPGARRGTRSASTAVVDDGWRR